MRAKMMKGLAALLAAMLLLGAGFELGAKAGKAGAIEREFSLMMIDGIARSGKLEM